MQSGIKITATVFDQNNVLTCNRDPFLCLIPRRLHNEGSSGRPVQQFYLSKAQKFCANVSHLGKRNRQDDAPDRSAQPQDAESRC